MGTHIISKRSDCGFGEVACYEDGLSVYAYGFFGQSTPLMAKLILLSFIK
jgi:hypothetical protein